MFGKAAAFSASSGTSVRRPPRWMFAVNTILFSLILLLAWSDSRVLKDAISGTLRHRASFIAYSLAILFFIGIYALSKRSFFIPAAYTLVAIYFLAMTYAMYRWGVDLPTAFIGYALLIVIASMLISVRLSFFVALGLTTLLAGFGWLQEKGIATAGSGSIGALTAYDGIQYSVLLGIVAILSWVSNRETEQSLRAARESELAMRRERDLLETKVAERTRELRDLEMERTAELARFAEFGRLATGMIHELLNLLTAVTLSVEDLERKGNDFTLEAKARLGRAIQAANRMDNFIRVIRRQMAGRNLASSFRLSEEIEQVIQLFAYKARKAGVRIVFAEKAPVVMLGEALKFHQVAANLISNAIDAYHGLPKSPARRREVRITLRDRGGAVCLEVQDWGEGIPPDNLAKIFDPFFTTKDIERGTGVGLASAKRIVESSFGGIISVASVPGEGSTFSVRFPV